MNYSNKGQLDANDWIIFIDCFKVYQLNSACVNSIYARCNGIACKTKPLRSTAKALLFGTYFNLV